MGTFYPGIFVSNWWHPAENLGPLHMSPVDRAGSVTEMKLVSVHMVTFSPLYEM